jgi:hypothetical protein
MQVVMNRTEAIEVRDGVFQAWQALTWPQWRDRVGQPEHLRVAGPSGVEYQVDIEAFRDARPEGDIRVMAAVDDMSFWRACLLLCADLSSRRQGETLG